VRVASSIFLQMLRGISMKCRKILLENYISKSILQGIIASEMRKMLLPTYTAYIGVHFVFIDEFVVRV
jgi:hypothetical protein